jgi:hypothetical protein
MHIFPSHIRYLGLRYLLCGWLTNKTQGAVAYNSAEHKPADVAFVCAACRDAAIRRAALFELRKNPAADTLFLQVSERQRGSAAACLDGVWMSTHKGCAELQEYELPGEALYHTPSAVATLLTV